MNEPQHLAKIKTPKLLKIPNKGVTNLRVRKLKNMQILRFRENKRKVREKMSMSVVQCQGKGSLTWLANLWNQACRACIPKDTKGGEEEKNCYLKFKIERDFLQFTLKKRIIKSQNRRNFGNTRAHFVICTRFKFCTRVTWKMHLFSAIKNRIFLSIVITNKKIQTTF